jgi:F0F1-type ATP synthase assembly protein I
MQAGVGQLPLERIPATFPGDDRKRVEQSYLRFAGVGVQYALTILILTMAGIWLDNKFETSPLFLVVLLILGFVGATWTLVREVLSPDKNAGDKKDGKK